MGEHRGVTDEKHPADRVVELFLFAPVGLALSAKELLPQLVERGRQQLSTQVTVARMLGQLAVKQGQVEAEKAFDRAREQAQATLEQLGVVGDGSGGAPPEPAAAASAPRDDSATEAPTLVAVPTDEPVGEPVDAPAKGATQAPSPDPVPVGERSEASGSELAIPDYDSLSASQVLPRLSGLDPAELEAVRAHEAGHRGRKTILHKVAQLQGA
jgi:hypothetical protein